MEATGMSAFNPHFTRQEGGIVYTLHLPDGVTCIRCDGAGYVSDPTWSPYRDNWTSEFIDCPDCLRTGLHPMPLTEFYYVYAQWEYRTRPV